MPFKIFSLLILVFLTGLESQVFASERLMELEGNENKLNSNRGMPGTYELRRFDEENGGKSLPEVVIEQPTEGRLVVKNLRFTQSSYHNELKRELSSFRQAHSGCNHKNSRCKLSAFERGEEILLEYLLYTLPNEVWSLVRERDGKHFSSPRLMKQGANVKASIRLEPEGDFYRLVVEADSGWRPRIPSRVDEEYQQSLREGLVAVPNRSFLLRKKSTIEEIRGLTYQWA